MSKQFNPYHAWLGIPAEEQPPNHYRLLGIPLFEPHPDVIQNGLDQRMAHVKSFATGPHATHSQRLLKEVSQAGVCLLRPEKKQTYDARLRSTLKASAETVALQPTPAPVSPRRVPAAPTNPSRPAPQAPSPGAVAVPAAMAGIQADGIQAQPAVKSSFPIVPMIVGGAIGLGGACLVLLFLSFGGDSTDQLAQDNPVDAPSDQAVDAPEDVDIPDPPDGATPAPEPQPKKPELQAGGTGASTPAPGSQPPMATEPPSTPSPFQPANTPSPSWPRPLPGSPTPPTAAPQPQTPSPFSPGTLPSTPPGTTPTFGTPGTPPTTPAAGTPKSIVLDLERSTMYVTLAENAEGKRVQAHVRSVANLGTPYALQPLDGVVSIGKPVDVVLSQYSGVKIHLAMRMKGKNAELQVTPEIETGPGKTSDFSKRTLDNAGRSMRKDAIALSRQLAAAQGEAQAIQNWLASPVLKTIPVRGARTQQLKILTSQTIPTLQKQMTYVQARANVLQQLSLLVKQIHEKASLDLMVQVASADKAK